MGRMLFVFLKMCSVTKSWLCLFSPIFISQESAFLGQNSPLPGVSVLVPARPPTAAFQPPTTPAPSRLRPLCGFASAGMRLPLPSPAPGCPCLRETPPESAASRPCSWGTACPDPQLLVRPSAQFWLLRFMYEFMQVQYTICIMYWSWRVVFVSFLPQVANLIAGTVLFHSHTHGSILSSSLQFSVSAHVLRGVQKCSDTAREMWSLGQPVLWNFLMSFVT